MTETFNETLIQKEGRNSTRNFKYTKLSRGNPKV